MTSTRGRADGGGVHGHADGDTRVVEYRAEDGVVDESLRVELTVRAKSIKSEETGQVRWAVEVFNQKDELVATYDLLTENVP